jgi:biotin carboxylase
MKTVLVTGGALGDLPIIKQLKTNGNFVVTSGNNPKDIGHLHSDRYIPCDYTDVDGLMKICEELKCDAIIPSAHDLAAIAASKVADRLGLPGYDNPSVSEIIHNKDQLRQALYGTGIPQPRFWLIHSEAELELETSWTFPLIVKPVDLTGGNGITICEDLYSLKYAFLRAQSISLSGKVIIEELLQGSYHGVTTIIVKQKVFFLFADNEYFLFDSFRVSATTSPSSLNSKQTDAIKEMVETFAQAYNLVDGLLHVQLILSEEEVTILEMCRRTPGDLYPMFVEFSTKTDYTSWITYPFLGTEIKFDSKPLASELLRNTGRFMLMPQRKGVFQGIEESSETFYEKTVPVLPLGSYIENPRKETLAIYFLRSKNSISEEMLTTIKSSLRPIISNQ